MNKILVPCDGSDSALRAVRHAASEAKSAPADLELLYVIAPVTAVTLAEALSAQQLDARFPPQAREALQPAIDILEQERVRYTVYCRLGEAAAEIAAHVRETGCSAVIMGTRGKGALASLIIGSVATEVVHLVDVPVTLIK